MPGFTPPARTVLLVGGGSGGHIYPNLAVAERLAEDLRPYLVVSQREVDRRIAEASGLPFTAIPAAPLSVRPGAGLRFLRQYCRGRAAVARLIRETRAAAMLATGGFVSGPALSAARARGCPAALIGLDAVPGKANRFAARHADAVRSALPPAPGVAPLPRARVVGYPLRRSAVADAAVTPAEARRRLGLDPARPTLLVFAGSQGALTINQALAAAAGDAELCDLLGEHRWQLLHVTGSAAGQLEAVRSAYNAAGVSAVTLAYCESMDLAWRAADLALTRAGAGTVAEAWANAVPCLMLPYPFHKDQHQRHNAAPLTALRGGVLLTDHADSAQNLASLRTALPPLLGDAEARAAMRRALAQHPPDDGAGHLADWLAEAARAAEAAS